MAVNRREKEETERGEKLAISIIPQKRLKTEGEVQERLRGASSSSSSSLEILDAHLGFFGLVEIASLANAEVKSLNILRNSVKKKKNPKEEEKLHLLPKPDWSCWRYVHRRMGGVHFHVFLFKRKLTKTDVNPSEARLFMNKKETKEVLQGALTRREEQLVFDQASGLEVEVIDRLGYRYNTRLKYWHTVRQFALFKEWKRLVKKNQLVEGDVIKLWFFRYGVDLKLGFLIIPGEDDD